MHLSKMPKNLKGFSILEIIIVLGLFSIIVSVAVVSVIQSFVLNRNTYHKAAADGLVVEGIDAVKSIQNTAWNDLVIGTNGLVLEMTGWEFNGATEDTVIYNNKYHRNILIEDVYRDINGNITLNPSGSVLDPNVKKVTSTVWWDTNGKDFDRHLSVYLTNNNQPIVGLGTGLLAYAEVSGGESYMRYKSYLLGDRWSSETTVPDYSIPPGYAIRWVELYSDPGSSNRTIVSKQIGANERIVANIYTGEAWNNTEVLSEFFAPSYPNSRDYDAEFISDNNLMVVFANGTTTPRYKIWNGSSWSTAQNIYTLSGQPVWMVLRKVSNNRAILAIRDSAQRNVTLFWNGSSWANFTTHANSSSGVNYDNIDFTYNSGLQKGALSFNETTDNNPNIRAYTYSTTWSSNVENQSLGSTARSMRVINHPISSLVIGCFNDAVPSIKCMTSDYTPSWGSPSTITDSTYSSDTVNFGMAFEKATGNNAVIVYSGGANKNIPKYKVYSTLSGLWGIEAELTQLGADANSEMVSARAVPKSGTDEIMFIIGGESGIINSIVWGGSSDAFYITGAKGNVSHSVDGPDNTYYWYDFEWGN